MSDQTTDQPDLPVALGGAQELETIDTLDALLSGASMAERTTWLCLDGKTEREYQDTVQELAALVDADGNPIDGGEASLEDESRVTELKELANQQLFAVRRSNRAFRSRAMPSDEFEAFEKAHRTGPNGTVKNQRTYENQLIARSVYSPEMTEADVETKLRKSVNRAQVVKLFNDCFHINASDGIDLPFSPAFLAGPKPTE